MTNYFHYTIIFLVFFREKHSYFLSKHIQRSYNDIKHSFISK